MLTQSEIEAAAATGIDALEAIVRGQAMNGVTGEDVARFFARFRPVLVGQLSTLLAQELEPAAAKLDRKWRGQWHFLNRDGLWTALDNSRRAEQEDWFLSRLVVHRPDLRATAESWVRANNREMPPAGVVTTQPIPGDKSGKLVVYEVTKAEVAQLDALPPDPDGFKRFAKLAYLDDEHSGDLLLDIAVAYFGQDASSVREPSASADPARVEQLRRIIQRQDPMLTAGQAADRALAGLLARRQILTAAGATTPDQGAALAAPAGPVAVDKEHAPSPDELLQALLERMDLRSPGERTEANIRAIRVLERPSEDQTANWRELMRYSGWGGLSIDENRALLPEAYIPEPAALIHEYYTPTTVALAIADFLRPWVPALPRSSDGFVQALEPSAGIGRLLNAASTPGFEQLQWTAIEYSAVSASLLQAIRPDVSVVNASFEAFLRENETILAGKVGLVLANPPYGARGATFTIDRNRSYREAKAYLYFLRRCLDLLAEGGLGIFVIPYGFMSGAGGSFVNKREQILKRHHLRAAFRLPSNLFPGTEIVTDVVVFESRGGELAAVLPDDQYIVEGKYFSRHPSHILGKEVGVGGDEDEVAAKPRWGYQVKGDFLGFPSFEPRLRCLSCVVTPLVAPAPSRVIAARRAFEDLPLAVQVASVLGDRTKRYLALFASGSHADLGIAASLQPDLLEALQAWVTNLGGERRNPWTDPSIQFAAKSQPSVAAFLSAFREDGSVLGQIQQKPAWQPRYEGSGDDLIAQAEWLYAVKRELTDEGLEIFRRELGRTTLEPLAAQLVSAGWCFDNNKWMPARDYYSGNLWDRYYRAKQASEAGDTISAAQLARLALLIKVHRIEDIDAEPRLPWIPLSLLTRWITQYTGKAPPKLVWRDGVLQPADYPYRLIGERVGISTQIMIGYLNHDLSYFTPKYTKGINPITGLEESAEEALDRARLTYHTKAKQSFKEFVMGSPDLATEVESAYNRLFRGFVMPEYSGDPMPISRWIGRIKLKPHQNRGARRLVANNGGLLGFDVGVGKTYTGIATIARLREEGRARRPIVLVPNTIVWKWFKDFKVALPDFRVLVVGSNRYIGRTGSYVSKIDTPEERSLKWRQFQAGEYDAAIVTYSVFNRTMLREETLRSFVYDSPVVLRKLSLDTRELAKKLVAGDDGIKKPRVSEKAIEKLVGPDAYRQLTRNERVAAIDQLAAEKTEAQRAELAQLQSIVATLSDLSERERAVFGQAMEKWIALRSDSYLEPDPGIYFEDLGCDTLVVDEAQNFKNLWPVAAREGGVPKYLGAIQEGSARAYGLALRAYLVKQRNGGSGVHLLSATPAKNSPLEYFTLLGYVDSGAWTRLGIMDPEVFIDRYLRLEMRSIVSPDMSISLRSVVAGFKNLDELRDIVFRYSEFRTAEEVGLVLPKPEVRQVTVQMDERQEKKYATYASQYRLALSRSKDDAKARMRALGLLARMALTAIHPELDEGPGGGSGDDDGDPGDDEGGRTGWTYRNANRVSNPACPKLTYIVEKVSVKPDCGHLIFCDNVAIHRWLVILLIAAGLDGKRIAVFNADQAKDPAKRQQIAEKFNGTPAITGIDGVVEQDAIPPEFDIVIANATAYEGIDLHVRTCEVYHVDLPWEPATLQQRNGRAVRQGNTQSVIGITYLLSDRSLDAVRLAMISGKLGWMRDILASADRETNNPAAQNELSGEEMVLFLARDPEEARQAIEAQKELLASQQAQRVQVQAWNSFRGLATRVAVLARVSDIAERQVLDQEMDELVARLHQIPATVWGWHFLIPMLRGGAPLFWGPNQAEWALVGESYVVAPSVEMSFATGRVNAKNIGVRKHGEAHFAKLSVQDFDRAIPASEVEQGPAAWDHQQDESLFRPKLERMVELPTGRFSDLGLNLAAESWRQYLVKAWWPTILQSVIGAGKELEFRIPVLNGVKLDLVEPQALAQPSVFESVMPFTQEAWSTFVTSAIESGLRYSDLNETALAWWDRTFPRGILRSKSNLDAISVQSRDGAVEITPLSVNGSLAVIAALDQDPDSSEGARFSIIHIPSGRAVSKDFRSEPAAEAALLYANRQNVDWNQNPPDLKGLDPGFHSIVNFIRDSAEVPNAEAIRQVALRM